jgi:hypothetical protein
MRGNADTLHPWLAARANEFEMSAISTRPSSVAHLTSSSPAALRMTRTEKPCGVVPQKPIDKLSSCDLA